MGERDPALDQLEPLVGEWDIEATHPLLEGVTRGRAVFEWLAGRKFLIERSDMADEFPSSIMVIGGGERPGIWPAHYFDSRGVMRVYQVSAAGGVINIWRDHPGFSQRGTFAFDDSGRTLRVQFELNEDGEWKTDALFIHRRRSG